jgi:hypothetical protein
VIDGEAVIWSQGRLNFDALQQRQPTMLPSMSWPWPGMTQGICRT